MILNEKKTGSLVLAVALFIVGLSFTRIAAQTPPTVIEEEIRAHMANLPFAMPTITVPRFPDRHVSIAEFGAVADGRSLNTKAFNDAIDKCAGSGGGTVIVPPGTWLTGPIKLQSNVNLRVERGALIQFSRRIEDFPLIAGLDGKSKRFIVTPPLYAYRAKNISITGDGIIDGSGDAWRYVKKEKLTENQWKQLVASGGVVSANGKEWWPSKEAMGGEEYLALLAKSGRQPMESDFAGVREFIRPDLVQLVQCEGVLLDGPTFQNSPKFHVRPAQSENVIIRNIKILAPWYGQNTDGLDPTSCRNVLIYNTTVDVGDDGICLKPSTIASSQKRGPSCENIVIVDCVVYHAHGGFSVGSESYGGVNNVYVHNCIYSGTDVGLRFKSARDRGGLVKNVYIDVVQMRAIESDAILFDMYYGGGAPDVEAAKNDDTHQPKPMTERTPRFQNISIKNIVCDGANRAFVIKGLAEMPVKNITLENITIQSVNGISCSQADGIQIRNSYIGAKHGPVITLDEATNVTVNNMRYPGGDVFLKVVGGKSNNVHLEHVDLSLAKKGIDLAPEVKSNCVTVN